MRTDNIEAGTTWGVQGDEVKGIHWDSVGSLTFELTGMGEGALRKLVVIPCHSVAFKRCKGAKDSKRCNPPNVPL